MGSLGDSRPWSGAALARLHLGNQSYLGREPRRRTEERRPYAVILACSDMTLSPETLFAAEAGDLWVVQAPALIAGAAEVATIEMAWELHRVPLVVVLSHTPCRFLDCCGQLGSAIAPFRDEVGASLAAAVASGTEPAGEGLARAHAHRMLRRIQTDMASRCGVDFTHAQVDERTGMVELDPPGSTHVP